MISEKARTLMEEIKNVYVPIVDWNTIDYDQIRNAANANVTPGPYPEGVSWSAAVIHGVRTERISVRESSGKLILHIHGGGMIAGNASSDRFMLSHIASLTRRDAVSVDYRLSPEAAQPAAIEDCAAVYRGLMEEGYNAREMVLLGESAGGMLVLSLCAYLKKEGIAMPGAVCAISPSVDSQYASQSMETNRENEIVVNQNLKEMMDAIYFKGADSKDPVLSPIYSDLRGWPPVYLYACKNEILRDESVRMCVKLQNAGVRCELTIEEDLFHTYMLFDLPESYEAFQRIANFINRF